MPNRYFRIFYLAKKLQLTKAILKKWGETKRFQCSRMKIR